MRTYRFVAWSLLAALTVTACAGTGSAAPSPVAAPSPDAADAASVEEPASVRARVEPYRLVTLGDSYTKGAWTASHQRDSWPAQLVSVMRDTSPRLRLIGNLAEQSQTSEDVLDYQLEQVASLQPDVVTLQVGANDAISPDVSDDDYRGNVDAILVGLLEIVPRERIFVITTPDHTLTPGGVQPYEPAEVGRAKVDMVNMILGDVAAARGVNIVDISDVNVLAASDPSLVIDAGPFPTAKQYRGWAELIGRTMQRALVASQP